MFEIKNSQKVSFINIGDGLQTERAWGLWSWRICLLDGLVQFTLVVCFPLYGNTHHPMIQNYMEVDKQSHYCFLANLFPHSVTELIDWYVHLSHIRDNINWVPKGRQCVPLFLNCKTVLWICRIHCCSDSLEIYKLSFCIEI